MNKLVMVLGMIVLVASLFFVFGSHTAHETVLGEVHQEGGTHGSHQAIGYVLLVLGVGVVFAGWKFG